MDIPQKIVRINDHEYYLLNNASSTDGDIQNGRTGNFWIVKINDTGEILWENSYGGSIIGEEVRDAILLPDNGLLMMGRISSMGGDITTHYGDMDIWLCRIDSTGTIVWQKTFGNQARDNALKIKLTADNTVLMIGAHYEPGGMIDCQVIEQYGSDVWMLEMDLHGTIQNQWCYGGSADDLGRDVIKIADGYVFVASTNSNDGDVSGLHGSQGEYEATDIWAVKIDLYGNIIWQRCLGGLASEWPVYLTQTDDSGFIIIGNAFSLDGDVTGNHSLFDYYSDIWVVKLTGDGELQWNHCFGGMSTERFWGIHSVLKKDDYNYVIGANANYLSDDVECDLFPNNTSIYNAWLLEIKDCNYYKPHMPVITSGLDTVCSTVSATSVYSIDTAKWASGYEWMLQPEEAGTIFSDLLSAEIAWNLTFEGTAEIKARGTSDCGASEWSEAKCVRVRTCLGIEEDGKTVGREDGKKRGLEVWPNPARGIVDCRWSMFDGRGDLSLRIYDVFGREIRQIDVPDTDHEIKFTVEDFVPGLYLVVLKDEDTFIGSAKMVVSR